MIDNSINDDKTIAGGGNGVVLASYYHVFHKLSRAPRL
jgi:hypothetical protein